MKLKKKWLTIGTGIALSVSLLASSMFVQFPGNNASYAAKSPAQMKLEQEIQRLKREQKEAEQRQNRLESQIRQLKHEERKLNDDILSLEIKMEELELKIIKKKTDIKSTEKLAFQKAQELTEAEARIEERDKMLKNRVRYMYESGGNVPYIEVLLGSASFGEFLERLDFLSFIVQQDKQIINDFVKDKELIVKNKQEIEKLLVSMNAKLVELKKLEAQSVQQKKNKRVRVAQIEDTQNELEKKIQEEEALMQRLVAQRAAKQRELHSLSFDGIFAWPVPSSQRVTSPFGTRRHPITGQIKGHKGTDIGAPNGTTIVAAAGGIVIVAEYLRGYGNCVIIEHGNNVRTLYAHIRNGGIKVGVGQRVERGQKIAEVGSTGRSTGNHLHFEVHKNGVQVDPMQYLRK